MSEHCVLYCNCTYAKVVPKDTKAEVLSKLSESGVAFDAVADLCEMSARKDPELRRYANTEGLRIAACYPRAVRWLFHAAGAPLRQENLRIENMREDEAEVVFEGLFDPENQAIEVDDSAPVSPEAGSSLNTPPQTPTDTPSGAAQ